MIVVGSSGRTDALSDFSNLGRTTVHLLAPGEQVMSTTYNNWYGLMDGTSMACPLVSGAAALLQSAALRWVAGGGTGGRDRGTGRLCRRAAGTPTLARLGHPLTAHARLPPSPTGARASAARACG